MGLEVKYDKGELDLTDFVSKIQFCNPKED